MASLELVWFIFGGRVDAESGYVLEAWQHRLPKPLLDYPERLGLAMKPLRHRGWAGKRRAKVGVKWLKK